MNDKPHVDQTDETLIINLYEDDNSELMVIIKDQLQTVFDPEFPLVDIYTLGLIYAIMIDEDEKIVVITMTYTTPACPAGDLIQEMMHNALIEKLPEFSLQIEVIFDPMRKIEMIKDKDLQRMFE